jgi:aspartate aminotransferase-like enzyme
MVAMAEPLIHHRSPEFRALMARLEANLGYLFQTASPVLTLTCSGTGGVEATFVSLFSPGDTIIAVNGGKFGERWVQMPRVFGLNAVEVRTPWGEAVEPGEVLGALRKHPEARGVYLTHSETSTGTALDIREIARVVRENSDALVCVDGISSVGALELRCDAWGVDVCVTASQKGLMIPPGLAFVSLGERAAPAAGRSTMPKFYFDLGKALKARERGDTPWTPAVSLIRGVDASLGMIRGEGIENIWARHGRLARGLRAGISALGLPLFSGSPSNAVTAVRLPAGVAWKEFSGALKKESGVTFGGGQGEFAGKIFRIAHLGYFDELDMITAVAAVERALASCGYGFEAGAGITATQRSFLV